MGISVSDHGRDRGKWIEAGSAIANDKSDQLVQLNVRLDRSRTLPLSLKNYTVGH